jgi:hypothetical protein
VPEHRDDRQYPTLALLRAVFGVALAFGTDRFLTLVDWRPARVGYFARIGWRPAGPPVPFPFSRSGAVLLAGSIDESLRCAREQPAFRALTEFASFITGTGRFPEVI